MQLLPVTLGVVAVLVIQAARFLAVGWVLLLLEQYLEDGFELGAWVLLVA